jgi:RecA-family ATPase
MSITKYKLSKRGRKKFDRKSPSVIHTALMEAWTKDASDAEAAAAANISPSTLSKYLKENPELQEIKESLKNLVTLRARSTVYDAIGVNAEMAMKWLERKKPDEYAPTTKNKIMAEIETNISKASIEEAKEALKQSGLYLKSENSGQDVPSSSS